MDLNGYILELYKIQKNFTGLGEAEKQILPLIAEKNCFSTYQCYKELNKQKKISYKNVHKKVKKLLEPGILKEVSKNGKHGSIYYKLSSFGIYFIFLTLKIEPFRLTKLIENYPNDGLFEYFLYQFIDRKTIKEIKSYSILAEIYIFLKECCSNIEYYFSLKKFSKPEKYRGSHIRLIDYIVNNLYIYFNCEIERSSSNLCMRILNHTEDELDKTDNFERITSLKLLSKDQRFRNTLQQLKNKFDNNFNKFESI